MVFNLSLTEAEPMHTLPITRKALIDEIVARNTFALTLRGLSPDAETDDYTYTGDSTRILGRARNAAQYSRFMLQTSTVRRRDGREEQVTKRVRKYAVARKYVRTGKHGETIRFAHRSADYASISPALHAERFTPAPSIIHDDTHHNGTRPAHKCYTHPPRVLIVPCDMHGFHMRGIVAFMPCAEITRQPRKIEPCAIASTDPHRTPAPIPARSTRIDDTCVHMITPVTCAVCSKRSK